MDTIFAVSSGKPPAAIAVLRISGPHAFAAAAALTGPLPEPRRAVVRAVRDPVDNAVLDRALVLAFRAPATATGEDIVELHLHGGRAVVAAVERVLRSLPDMRQAEPGEFTRRALINGRIDLTEAEGLGDLLAAETESQRRIAMLASEGGIRRRVTEWSNRLVALSATVEAQLDFSDEDDVGKTGVDHVRQGARALAADIRTVLDQAPIERVKDGIRVVLAGPPNSGKSSLLNAMIDREAAIVSPVAGTTRDRIDAAVQRDGIAYVVTDTAGLHDASSDPIERIGIDRARAAIEAADIIVWLGDDPPAIPALWIHARADQPGRKVPPAARDLAVSAVTGAGLVALWLAIGAAARRLLPQLDAIALNRRQRDLATLVTIALRDIDDTDDLLLVADGLRQARIALDRIGGKSDTEAMLDSLFGTFCIGK